MKQHTLYTVLAVGCTALSLSAKEVVLEASAGAPDHPVSVRRGLHENQDWAEFRGFHYTDAKKGLPRLFLIGDSINGQYRKGVQERLEGMANVTWFTSCYCVSTPNFIKLLDLYLGDATYDVVHINNGGHSFQTDLKDYENGLRAALKLIRAKQPQAKLIWANTTPNRDPEVNARCKELNAVADRVAKEVGVDGVDDLYAALLSAPENSRWSDGAHAAAAGRKALETAVTKSILPHLGVKPAPTPEACHVKHAEKGIIAIIHFGLNTFVDKEWGFGDTPPSAFNPTKVDTDQWVDAMIAGGIKRVVMVTKHHDGFNLWPSPYNKDYTVANSPWLGGKGDLVKMIQESCAKKGIEFGVYLSPWDRHQASYATPAYTEYYHQQFEELFAKYGPLTEVWLDGANGGDGYYGGAREKRKLAVPAWDYYQIPKVLERMGKLHPDSVAFNGDGPHSVVYVGNERGFAPDGVGCVSKRGFWETQECPTPFRKGWFWHEKDAPKPLSHLVDVYFSSVGRGCVLNLGIAPNREGVVGEDDVKRLKEFGDYVREFNATDFAKGAVIWRFPGVYQIDLAAPKTINAVDAVEDLSFGQKIKAWKFEYDKDGVWTPVTDAATIGFRRIERFEPVTSHRFRIVVTESDPGCRIETVALRWAKTVPPDPGYVAKRNYYANNGSQVTTSYGDSKNEFVAHWTYPGKAHGFKFDPQHNLGNLPDKWEMRLSEDGKTWSDVVQSGEFGNILANPVEQFVDFPKEMKVRFVKITATSAVKGEATFNPNHVHTIMFY